METSVLLQYAYLGDKDIRATMVELWQAETQGFHDIFDSPQDWPLGRQLTEDGWDAYLRLMPEALARYDDEWLMQEIDNAGFWNDVLFRRGRPVQYDKADACRKLAMGEFNTAYVRGVATVLQQRGASTATVYRAAHADENRNSYCSKLEESQVDVRQIIDDHRRNYYPQRDSKARPIPSGPHCHHTIR